MDGEETGHQAVPVAAALGRGIFMDLERHVILPLSPLLCVTMRSLLETGGHTKESWLQEPRRDAAQGNMLKAMVRGGVVRIRVKSKPLLSKRFLSFCCLPYVSASFFVFFSSVSDLSLSDLSSSVPRNRY